MIEGFKRHFFCLFLLCVFSFNVERFANVSPWLLDPEDYFINRLGLLFCHIEDIAG